MFKKFLRSDTTRLKRLGSHRRKLQRWRRPRGTHNKIRRKRFGYPGLPLVGRRTAKSEAYKIEGLNPILVHNLSELQNFDKNTGIIIARIGAKKKLELIKKAQELKIKIFNLGGKNETR